MLLKVVALLSAVISAAVCGLAGGFAGWAWLWILPVGFVGAGLVIVLILFLMAWIPSLFADNTKQYDDDSPYFRWIIKYYAPAVFTLMRVKIQVTGMEKVPEKGRFMLVCNHVDNLDSGIMLAGFNRHQLAFVAKKETADMFLIGKLMPRVLCQFLDRENDRNALKTILRCIQILKEDKASIMAFPEGGIIEDGAVLHHYRNGVFKIAQKGGVPIVVCTIRGTAELLNNFLHFRRSFVDLRILDVVPAEDLKGVTTADIGNRVFALMAEDLGYREET